MRERVNKGLILLLAAGVMAAALCGCDGNAPKVVHFPEISNNWKFIREML